MDEVIAYWSSADLVRTEEYRGRSLKLERASLVKDFERQGHLACFVIDSDGGIEGLFVLRRVVGRLIIEGHLTKTLEITFWTSGPSVQSEAYAFHPMEIMGHDEEKEIMDHVKLLLDCDYVFPLEVGAFRIDGSAG